LHATIELPSAEKVCLADIHFDCIEDDTERYGQAQIVASELKSLDVACLLMGDFNDEPGTRTVELFQSFMLEAKKPWGSRLTFPSNVPAREIDFLFLSPSSRWAVRSVEVADDSMTSDHRPILADLTLLGG
jgi:endonuclease/exonuclease/phosphatase family metal-dependent hydrolase